MGLHVCGLQVLAGSDRLEHGVRLHGVIRQVQRMRWRGGTASGTCDPSNNIVRWRSTGDGVFVHANGLILHVASSSSWRSNCDVNSSVVYQESPFIARDFDLRADHEFFQESSNPSNSFTSCVWWIVASSGPNSQRPLNC